MKLLKSVFAVMIAFAGLAYAPSALAQGTVYVVHGIPGGDIGQPAELPVDISVNGACALEGFVFGEIAGPLPFDAGSYDIAIALADTNNPCGNAPVLSAGGIQVEDGKNYSIVAHLDEAGGITASVLLNDVTASAYTARVNVAHVAAAPRVDARLKSQRKWWLPSRTIRDLGNGEIADTYVWAGDYNVTLYPAGSRQTVFGPVPVSLERGVAYGVYAVGSLGTGSFTLLTTTLENAAPAPASAFVVHGIPGSDLGLDPALPVDVSVNGACALPGFTFGEIAGPLDLPAGSYDIAIGLANAAAPCSEAPVIEANGLELTGGKSYSIVAHLDEAGTPTATAFMNNTWGNRFFAGVNVFHTAAAPRVDVKLQRENVKRWVRFLRDIGNGEAASRNVFVGRWEASIRPAGSRDTVFGPVTLDLAGDTIYLVYAVGSLSTGSFTLLTATTEAALH
ncbi:MAG TPA: DUF4397 domain-containing protein [Woeseiaceae bacterium]|jgi:hypothetical protein|nr:DUF4397 domain-containing protein [Woeseiaceae bacterium]